MKLTRSELAKQFELVVQQEIINHNKQIESTNLVICQIQKSLQDLSTDMASHIAHLENELWKIQDELKDIRITSKNKEIRLSNKVDAVSDEMDLLDFEIHRRMDLIEDTSCDEGTFLEKMDQVNEAINCFEKSIEEQKFYIHSEIYDLRKECDRWFQEFVKEIESRPSEIPKIQQELEKKILASVIDAKGVLKEFEILKKENFINKKKIENLYTLIDRLKQERSN